MREAAALWGKHRRAGRPPRRATRKWSHPDLLPQLPDEQSEDNSNEENGAASATTGTEQTTAQQDIPDSIIGMPNCPSCSTRKSTRAMTPTARTTPTAQMTPAIRTLPATAVTGRSVISCAAIGPIVLAGARIGHVERVFGTRDRHVHQSPFLFQKVAFGR